MRVRSPPPRPTTDCKCGLFRLSRIRVDRNRAKIKRGTRTIRPPARAAPATVPTSGSIRMQGSCAPAIPVDQDRAGSEPRRSELIRRGPLGTAPADSQRKDRAFGRPPRQESESSRRTVEQDRESRKKKRRARPATLAQTPPAGPSVGREPVPATHRRPRRKERYAASDPTLPGGAEPAAPRLQPHDRAEPCGPCRASARHRRRCRSRPSAAARRQHDQEERQAARYALPRDRDHQSADLTHTDAAGRRAWRARRPAGRVPSSREPCRRHADTAKAG